MGFSRQEYWSGLPLRVVKLDIFLYCFHMGLFKTPQLSYVFVVYIKLCCFDYSFCVCFNVCNWSRKWQPTQYSCLGNSMDGGAWQTTVHGLAKSWIQLSNWTTQQHLLGQVFPLQYFLSYFCHFYGNDPPKIKFFHKNFRLCSSCFWRNPTEILNL